MYLCAVNHLILQVGRWTCKYRAALMCSRSDVAPRCSPNESVSPTSLDLWERVHIWFSKMDKYSAQPEQLPNEPEPCGSWHSKLTLQKSLVVADTHPSKQMCFQRFNLKQQSKRSGETSGISMRSSDQRRVFFLNPGFPEHPNQIWPWTCYGTFF